jgi:hypothetical protein
MRWETVHSAKTSFCVKINPGFLDYVQVLSKKHSQSIKNNKSVQESFMVGWLVGWLAGWLAGWLVGWLVGQSVGQ